MADTSGSTDQDTMDLVAGIVSAYVAHNTISTQQLPDLIASVHGALLGIGYVEPAVVQQEPAVPIRGSVRQDSIACLECGKRFKSLKRHLGTSHGLTPADYKAKWSLGPDYPMVSPHYAQFRSKFAIERGLGRRKPA